MAPREKRPHSSTDSSSASEGGREVKRQKTTPHRGKWATEVQNILDLLSPATGGSLADFNEEEEREEREGVIPIYTRLVETELEKLRGTKDIKRLEAQLATIESYLKSYQDAYESYLETHGAVVEVMLTLRNLIWSIKEARDRLPGLKGTLLIKPPPSDYARKRWIDYQETTYPILCMRPVMCRGLPVSLLDSVFATYLSVSKKTLPSTPEADAALFTARQLCSTMGDHFDKETARRSSFLEATKDLFSQWATIKGSMSEGVTTTDTTISVDGTAMVFVEIKNKKTGGEGYMQACRGYEMSTEELGEKNPMFLKQGAPAFLLCLSDEELRIAGAFKDGPNVVVEPLSLLLLNPDSREDGRTIQLAQHLFALHSCLVTIAGKIKSRTPLPAYTVGYPRVFPKVLNTATDQDEPLEFKRLRKDLWETNEGTIDFLNLIFEATLGAEKVLAKVVFRSYGKDVHADLARHQMAPQLHGTSSVQDCASLVVMQLLEDGWTTLFHYRHNVYPGGIPEPHKSKLSTRLEEILEYLSTIRKVHGDFRMANVMLKQEEEEKAMLIDFDWAGEAGKVRYPVTRSRGFRYPGSPGGPIEATHDRELYETWKTELLAMAVSLDS